MRRTILRRLEALEKEEHARQDKKSGAFRYALWSIWKIVIAHYVGGLETELDDIICAYARALIHTAERIVADDEIIKLVDAIRKRDLVALRGDHEHVVRVLFDAHGLDYAQSPNKDLYEAFVYLVEQLPEKWSDWLRSELRSEYKEVEIPEGSNIPRQLSCDNFLLFGRDN